MSDCPTPRKQAHTSRDQAVRHVRALQLRRNANQDLHPYRCACGAWHVGHSVVLLRRRIHRALQTGDA